MRNCSLLWAALCLATPLAWGGPVSMAGKACHLPGSEETLRCLTVQVERDYAKPGSGKIDLHVTIAPAYRDPAKGDPVFLLAGGPGQGASDLVGVLGPAMRTVRATRDLIYVDQRGTGRSGKLDCEAKPGDENASEAQGEAALADCLKKLKTDFAVYNTAYSARDLDQVRQALGYGAINLWGGSYGTRLGQAYARAFPATVRSLILDGVAPPDQIIPAGARDAQAAMDTLFKQCAQDKPCAKAFPHLREEFATVLERVAGGVKVDLPDPRTALPASVSLDSRRFISTVHSILYSPQDNRRLPFLIHSAYEGRWAPFIARSKQGGDVSTEGSMAMVLHLAIVCAEDIPRMTPELIANDTAGSFFSTPLVTRLNSYCPYVKVPPAALSSARIMAPALLLSGALDPVTPPRRAEAAAKLIAQSQHFVAANAGHGISNLGCVPRLMRQFLDDPAKPVDAKCLQEIPAPSFQLGAAGPHP